MLFGLVYNGCVSVGVAFMCNDIMIEPTPKTFKYKYSLCWLCAKNFILVLAQCTFVQTLLKTFFPLSDF